MLIPLIAILLLIETVKGSGLEKLPYYIKIYLYTKDKQNYGKLLQMVDDVSADYSRGVPAHIAKRKLNSYFENCDIMIEQWLMRRKHSLSQQIKYDPTHDQITMRKLLDQHYLLIINSMQDRPDDDKHFLDRWMLRFFWMQEFMHAMLAAVIIKKESDTLQHGMSLFREIMRSSMVWVTINERKIINDGFNGLIRPPQSYSMQFREFSEYGYWSLDDINRIRTTAKHVHYDLLLKNAQYYRTFGMLNASQYSFEDVESFLQVSKEINNSLSRHKHLYFLTHQMQQWSREVKNRREREKQLQLKDNYVMARPMWTPWYGLSLPTFHVLKEFQSTAGEFFTDFLNYGLKGITLLISIHNHYDYSLLWDLHLSSLDVILHATQPELVPVLPKFRLQYRKIFELFEDPEARSSMLLLQGFRPHSPFFSHLSSSEWKERVLQEMEEMQKLLGKKRVHSKIVKYVNSL